MKFSCNAAVAFAILSCGLLSTTLAIPTPQMLTMGDEGSPASVQSRQCIVGRCNAILNDDSHARSMTRKIWSWIKDSVHQSPQALEIRQILHVAGEEGGDVQSRQMHAGQAADDTDVEIRQIMHAMGAEEAVSTQSRQMHGGLMAEDGAVESRQIMHSASADDGEMESRQISSHGSKGEDVHNRQVMLSAEDGEVESRLVAE